MFFFQDQKYVSDLYFSPSLFFDKFCMFELRGFATVRKGKVNRKFNIPFDNIAYLQAIC